MKLCYYFITGKFGAQDSVGLLQIHQWKIGKTTIRFKNRYRIKNKIV